MVAIARAAAASMRCRGRNPDEHNFRDWLLLHYLLSLPFSVCVPQTLEFSLVRAAAAGNGEGTDSLTGRHRLHIYDPNSLHSQSIIY